MNLQSKLKHWLGEHEMIALIIMSVFWTLIVGLFWTLDYHTTVENLNRLGVAYNPDKLLIQQVTSALSILLLIPLVSYLSRIVGSKQFSLPTNTMFLVAGSFVFALIHYLLIVGFRVSSYPVFGLDYIFSSFWSNVWFEYGKDVKIYAAMLCIIFAYRYWYHWNIGRIVESNDENMPETLLVQTGRGTTIIEVSSIYFIEAAKNYVVLNTGNNEYLMRETLTNIQSRLDSSRFVRTQRSFVINLHHFEQLIKQGDGQLFAQLDNKKLIPVSKTYKNFLENTGH